MTKFETWSIRPTQAANFVDAVLYANDNDLALNRHLTILWDGNAVGDRIQREQTRFLERMSKWLKYRGVSPAYAWVIERGRERGLHSHVLVHVPAVHFIAFRRRLRAWLGSTGASSNTKITTVRYRPDNMRGIAGLVRYLLKGIAPSHAATLGIKPVAEGNVFGERVGTCQRIGRKARNCDGWMRDPRLTAFPSATEQVHPHRVSIERRRRRVRFGLMPEPMVKLQAGSKSGGQDC
jgi:hypothetical protein